MTDSAKQGDLHGARIALVIPVYNEWESSSQLLHLLDQELAGKGIEAEVLLVNDGSSEPRPEGFPGRTFTALTKVTELRLWRNVGHQRAICIGLVHAQEHCSAEHFVVMDGDGEDRPEDVPRLIEAARGRPGAIVFAARTIRSEGIVFRLFYRLYCLFFRFLTGYRVIGGNFSLIPSQLLESATSVSEIWNHYAAAILKARFPVTSVPSRRGQRLHGKSKMNFSAFVAHGFSAISVFGDMAAVRMFLLSGFFGVLTGLAALGTHLTEQLSSLALPPCLFWSFALCSLFWSLASVVFLCCSLLVLHLRGMQPVVPAKTAGELLRDSKKID